MAAACSGSRAHFSIPSIGEPLSRWAGIWSRCSASTRTHHWSRPDGRGLVPLLALSAHPGARLEAIEPAGAVFRSKSGARQTYTLGMPAMDAAVMWWECAAIIGNHDMQPSREDA